MLAWLAVASLLVAAVSAIQLSSGASRSQSRGLAGNRFLDPGTPLSGPAPDFALTDQFGRRVEMSSFRGRAVLLDFNDSRCTTICPLTTQAMVQAKALLGSAGARLELLGVDANPNATEVSAVRAYSQLHGMLHRWHFLTGSRAELERVWRAYHIEVAVRRGQIDHTPALFLIDPQGQLNRLYLTQQSYSAVAQLAQLLAQRVASLLPGHPRVRATLSYAEAPPIGPESRVSLPGAAGGTVTVGAVRQLAFFFASWTTEVFPLRAQLRALEGYQRLAAREGLPRLVAIDEGSVEPFSGAAARVVGSLSASPSFPVAVDQSGRVGDGYQVQDLPSLVLTGADGRILAYYDAATEGPLGTAGIVRAVRAALRAVPPVPTAIGPAQAALAGSPAPLAGLHRQAGQLLGPLTALVSRLRALRGYPVVLNAWASWCGPCRSEFSLFASASVRFGREIAFLGVDTGDSPADAASFLAAHPVSYPSYQTPSTSQFTGVLPGGLTGLPTTVLIDRSGRVAYVHTGQYDTQGSLDADIRQYALGG